MRLASYGEVSTTVHLCGVCARSIGRAAARMGHFYAYMQTDFDLKNEEQQKTACENINQNNNGYENRKQPHTVRARTDYNI